MGGNACANRFHHLEIDPQKIIPAHPRFARNAGGYDADIGPCDAGIIIGAGQGGIEFRRRARLCNIERFTLRRAFGDIEQDHVAQFFQRNQMGERAADLPRADQCDFGSGHVTSPAGLIVWLMEWADA